MTSQQLSASGRSMVKNVISADTVVLRGKPVGGPPPELVFSLSHLVAPRLGSSKEPEKEEPFAFEAREYLRRLVVGKDVAYKTEYTTTSNNRSFGTLILRVPVDGETNVAKLLVKEGWAKIRMRDGKHAPTDEQLELAELEKEAQEAKKGIWAEKSEIRKVYHTYTGETRSIIDDLKKQPIPAVLEQVRDGSTFRVLLILPKDQGNIYQHITLSLSGIKCPTLRKDIPNQEDIIEPYSEEAKYFVESRLLQKDIHVVLESFSGTGPSASFVGSIKFPAGNIAEALLSEGFAKIIGWNLSVVSGQGHIAAYKAAEEKARQRRLRVWHSFVKTTDDAQGGKGASCVLGNEYDAIVTKIIGADLIMVEPVATPGKDRKLQLASIRGPKRAKNDAGFEVGYSHDAQEFLRSRLVGNKVQVRIDYIKASEGEYEQRECATITLANGTNIGETLVSRGLATVIKHRKDDNSRSSDYDKLVQAEEKSVSGSKGMHSTKEPPVHRIIDASENAAKSRQYLPFLQRSNRLTGIVEHVSSGSRLRITVPAQSCRLVMVLSGIRAPKYARNANEKSEPFGAEAAEFVSRLVMQREVDLEFEGVDKVGGFIGTVFFKPANSLHHGAVDAASTQVNLAVALLENGLATVHDYSASQSHYTNQLYDAEIEAKNARLNIWTDYDPASEFVDENRQESNDLTGGVSNQQSGSLGTSDMREIFVSNISADTGLLHIQVQGSDLIKLEQLMVKFSQYHSTAGQQAIAPFALKAGDYCSAQFTVDKCWYRARVCKLNGANSYTIVYIDYGNSETVPGSRLRGLPAQFGTSILKPQAVEAQLAYVQLPGVAADQSAFLATATIEAGAEFSEEAFAMLRDLTEGKKLAAQIVGRSTGTPAAGTKTGSVVLNLVVYDLEQVKNPANGDGRVWSVNEQLVREGLAYVSRNWTRKIEMERRAKHKSVGGSLAAMSLNNTAVDTSVLEQIVAAQDIAKQERINLWQYGDFLADDDI
ncbi:hypothetical protein BDV3_004817 [Batrachochytrium dendrobatidis]